MQESKKENLEKWLDNMIEAHKQIWNNMDFNCDDETYTGIGYDRLPDVISVHGLIRIAEILGCCIKFIPQNFGVCASVMYKGVEFIEWQY